MSRRGGRRHRRGGRGRGGRRGHADAPPTTPPPPTPPPSAAPPAPLPPPKRQHWRKTRLNSRQRAKLYPDVAAQQGGEYCVNCNRDAKDLGEAGECLTLCIDHVNNDQSDNRRVNLQLLCRACNTEKNHPALPPGAEHAKPPSTEILLNRSYEGRFRRWCAGEFAKNDALLYAVDDLISDGAELTGASPDTIKKYIHKMRSPKFGMYDLLGPLTPGGKVYLKLKEQYRGDSPIQMPTESEDAEPSAQTILDDALEDGGAGASAGAP